jgi:hypothetical protein
MVDFAGRKVQVGHTHGAGSESLIFMAQYISEEFTPQAEVGATMSVRTPPETSVADFCPHLCCAPGTVLTAMA